jgi:phosphate transport system substrate-binding protein
LYRPNSRRAGRILPVILLLCIQVATARDQVIAVGSSTIYPFASAVAEHLGRSSQFPAPKVESWGTGGGIKTFCEGIGVRQADIALASREMTESELQDCADNGVSDILRIRFGLDGVVLATSAKRPQLELTLRQVYLALAREVPAGDGSQNLVPNPYRRWIQIDPGFPDAPIQVYGPPLTSGTRDVLADLALTAGCRTFDWLAALETSDPRAFAGACQAIREDGGYVSTGENDNLIVRKVSDSTEAIGIFGFNYYDQNRAILRATIIEGVAPEFETIHDHKYPLSRPLYVYAKAEHMKSIPGFKPFLEELLSDRASGPEGYLVDRGLVPLEDKERKKNLALVRSSGTSPQIGAH